LFGIEETFFWKVFEVGVGFQIQKVRRRSSLSLSSLCNYLLLLLSPSINIVLLLPAIRFMVEVHGHTYRSMGIFFLIEIYFI
jgi:hypothetical protein